MNKIRVNVKDWAVLLILLICTNKWMIEGVIGLPSLEGLILVAGLLMIFIKRQKINMASIFWAIYGISILFSVAISGSTLSVWGRAFVMVSIVAFSILSHYEQFGCEKVIMVLVKIAVFHSFFVFFHFILGERFNSLYFPLLRETAKNSAQSYYRKGYYFGLLYSPHELAGILSFSIVALLLWNFVYRKKNIRRYILVAILFVALLLSAKKGVLIISIIVFILTLTLYLAEKKQWHKILGIMMIAFITFGAVGYYILKNPDNVLFYRLSQFLDKIANGESADSGRNMLYEYAIQSWQSHKVFGIGWGHFLGWSTSVFGYEAAHQVNLDYLQWLCETGIVGFVLNLTPVLITLYQAIFISRRLLKKIKDRKDLWIILFAIFIQIFTVIYAFIEVPFYDICFFFMYMFSCMIINGVYAKRRFYLQTSDKNSRSMQKRMEL